MSGVVLGVPVQEMRQDHPCVIWKEGALMNRAERRKTGKSGKAKTFVLTEEQLTKVKNDAMDEAFQLLLSVPLMVNHDKFGHGAIRQDRFMSGCLMWLTSLQNGEITLDEIVKTCQDECGVQLIKDTSRTYWIPKKRHKH